MSHRTRDAAALFRHLINNSTTPLIGSAIGSLLVTLAYIGSPLSHLVFGWMAVVYLTIAIRFWLIQRCRVWLKTRGYNHDEAIKYAVTTGLSGIAWGLGGLFVLKGTPIAMVITITAIQAMVMGSALTLASFLPAFFAFAVPAMLPMIVVLAVNGSTTNMVLATCSALFLALIVSIARRFNNSLRYTWQLTFDKEDLVKALTEARDEQSILAKTDSLTGIANRRRFDETLKLEITRLQRSGAPLSLLIVDVDHFKAFNDTYGHIAGDECLRRIADVFQKNINRASDLAARYGGEEFAGILPETDDAGAISLAEQIRAEVAALKIAHANSPTASHVTISIGVATMNCSDTLSSREAIAIADQQLYRAKSEGRNRVASSNGLKSAAQEAVSETEFYTLEPSP